LQIEPNDWTYSNLGAVLQLDGKYAEAAAMFRKAIELRPNDYQVWGNLASCYLWNPAERSKAEETYKKAIQLAEERLRSEPNDVRVIARLGAFYATIGDSQRSMPLLRRAAALGSESAYANAKLAEAYELLGQREEALRWIGKALRLGYSPQQIKRSPEMARLWKDPRFPLTEK
jgi:tetratricopeptide (TPR) repeat protein